MPKSPLLVFQVLLLTCSHCKQLAIQDIQPAYDDDDDDSSAERFRFKINMYKMREEREIEPKTLAHMVSSTLYERR